MKIIRLTPDFFINIRRKLSIIRCTESLNAGMQPFVYIQSKETNMRQIRIRTYIHSLYIQSKDINNCMLISDKL